MKFKHLFFACAAVQAVCIVMGSSERNLTTLSIAIPGFIFAVYMTVVSGEKRL